MKVYFKYHPAPYVATIRRELEQTGRSVLDAGDEASLAPYRTDDPSINVVDVVDCIVIAASVLNQDFTYLLAMAIAKQKPVLCLVPKGTQVEESILTLQRDKNISKNLKLLFVTPSTAVAAVLDFVDQVEAGYGNELPSIKFTLRLTKSQERYLSWKGKQTKKTKAEYLRLVIDDIKKNDAQFR